MDALITVFYNYSGNDGDKYKLNKGELKELLNSELTDFLTVKEDIPFLPLSSQPWLSFGSACKLPTPTDLNTLGFAVCPAMHLNMEV